VSFSNWHIHTSYLVIGIVLAIDAYVGVHSWQQEHDARLLAEQKIAVDEQQVKQLQDSITANNQAMQGKFSALRWALGDEWDFLDT
jgi:hypothetical protein